MVSWLLSSESKEMATYQKTILPFGLAIPSAREFHKEGKAEPIPKFIQSPRIFLARQRTCLQTLIASH